MRSETSFVLDGDLIVIDAVVIGPSGRANIQLTLDTGAARRQRRGVQRRWVVFALKP